MKKNLLLLVADHLDTVPDADFNLADWRRKVDTPCGFVGCAIWHAVTIPEIAQAGLRMAGDKPVCGNICGWQAVEYVFGLDRKTSSYLFLDECYEKLDKTKPKEVAARIREFVATGLCLKNHK